MRTGHHPARPRPADGSPRGAIRRGWAGDDLLDMHHGGFGLVIASGVFVNSYLEYGYGTNDLIITSRNRRHKFDAFLTWSQALLGWIEARPFVQITVDTDMGHGTDSVQSYVGLNFDLKHFLWRERTAQRGDSPASSRERPD